MSTMRMELAALTKQAEDIARVEERARQLKIAQERYRETVNVRLRERFQDPAEIEKYLDDSD